MEIERIKALEQYEARELQRNDERRRGAKVLEDQIAQREYERLRQVRVVDVCVCKCVCVSVVCMHPYTHACEYELVYILGEQAQSGMYVRCWLQVFQKRSLPLPLGNSTI